MIDSVPIHDAMNIQLPPRRPGQTLDDALTEQAVELAGDLARFLQAAALPTFFDIEILAELTEAREEASAAVSRLNTKYSFITTVDGESTFYDPARQTIRLKFFRDDPQTFRQLNHRAANYFQARGDVRQRMYHLLASDEQDQRVGYAMLLNLFERAETEFQPGVAQLLTRLAAEQRPFLAAEYQPTLRWLEGRLARLQGDAESAVKIFREVLRSNPTAELRACVELSLAEALLDMQNWAEAIDSGEAARVAFAGGQNHYSEARALMVLARAYAGLAQSARGSRAVRPAISDFLLNVTYEIGTFLERLPILLYLLTQLGARHVLPVLSQIARDQDWVIARLFALAAQLMRQAESLLGKMKQDAQDASSPTEAIWFEARRTRAALYRTLGHPTYAIDLLEDLQEHPLVLESKYRAARLSLDLADVYYDAERYETAAEEARKAIPEFHAVGDMEREALAQLLMGKAIAAAAQEREPVRTERLNVALEAMSASLALYQKLGQKSSIAEVGRLLDQMAELPQLKSDHPVRVRASELARQVPERRYPVRYTHPLIHNFRTFALIGAAVSLLLILFFSVHTSSGADIGAAAIVHSKQIASQDATGDSTNDFAPQLSTEAPADELRPEFDVRLATQFILAVVVAYLLLYILVGFLLINVASVQALREAQPQVLALDDLGIRQLGRGDETEKSLKWKVTQEERQNVIQEAIQVDRTLVDRELAGYSQLVLFGNGISIQVPGRATDYESKLRKAILARLPIPQRRFGFSFVESWAGLVFFGTLLILLIFLVVSSLNSDAVLQNVLNTPYSFSDLYSYAYLGLLIPLLWWLIVNPLREAFVLAPTRRMPLVIGAAGLAVEGIILLQPPALAPLFPRPDIYPILVGAFLVIAAAAFVFFARNWEALPSHRTAFVYAPLIRIGALLLAALAVLGALFYTQQEVRAYHALVLGNERRDKGQAALSQDQSLADNLRLAEAQASYESALALSPYNVAAFANRGVVHLNQGTVFANQQDDTGALEAYDGAIRDYNQAIALRPDQPILYANRAVAFERKAQYTGLNKLPSALAIPLPIFLDLQYALRDYGLALELDPTNVDYYLRSGSITHKLKEYYLAIALYTRVLALDPKNADAYAGRGWAFFQLGMQDREQSNFDLREKKYLRSLEAKSYMSENFFHASSDFEMADILLQGEIQNGAPTAPAAQSYPRADELNSSDITAALERDAPLTLSQRRANVLNGRGWVAFRLEQYPSARSFFEQAHALDPQNPEYAFLLGNLYWIFSRNSAVDKSSLDYRILIRQGTAMYELGVPSISEPIRRAYLYRTLGQFYYILAQPNVRLSEEDARVQYEKGIAADDKAIELDNAHPEYSLRRGEIGLELARLLRKTNPKAALAGYNASIADLKQADEKIAKELVNAFRRIDSKLLGTWQDEARKVLAVAVQERDRVANELDSMYSQNKSSHRR